MKLFAALSAFSVSVEACGGTINEFTGINSPRGDYGSEFYNNNLDCTWNIELGDITGFVIINNLFDVEYNWNCGFDYLKLIDGNGFEQNFCGETGEGFSSYSQAPSSSSDSDSSSSYSSIGGAYSYYGRKRRSVKDDKESPRIDLANVSNDGFPDRMFIAGGSATIQFITDRYTRHRGFQFYIVKPGRFEIIQYHVRRVINSVAATERWGGRYAGRMEKILNRLQAADTGVSCYEENFPGEAADEGDEVTVFDANNMCKLNGQVNAAINSYARHFACEGRGKVHRQIIRSARKIKKFFFDKNDC